MKMKVYKKLLILFFSFLVLLIGVVTYWNSKENTMVVRAFGPLSVIFPSDPVFNETNWEPGKTITKTIKMENTDLFGRNVGIKATNFQDTGNPGLSNALNIKITTNNNLIYGPKKLSDFYNEKVVWLGKLAKSEKKNFDLTIDMDLTAGNQFQGSSTTFDLLAGIDNADTPFPPLPTFNPFPTLAPFRRFGPFSNFPSFLRIR